MRRLLHVVTGHLGTWLELRHGVWHHVCRCGHAAPAARVTCCPSKARDAYDYRKAVEGKRRAERNGLERQLIAARRSEPWRPASVKTFRLRQGER